MENQEKVTNIAETVEKAAEETKADSFFAELKDLQDKYNSDINISIDFPEYKVLPDDLKLALSVMNKHRLRYVIGIRGREVKDDNKI